MEDNAALIATFTNAPDGVESRVVKTPRGFAVNLRDTDANEFVPGVKIFPGLTAAEAYARKIAGV